MTKKPRAGHGPHRSKEFWRRTIAEWQVSDVHQEDFCRQRGVSASTFHRWRHRLEQEDQIESSALKAEEFIPVKIVDAPAPPSSLELSLPGGLRLTIPAGFDSETLERVLATLEGRSC